KADVPLVISNEVSILAYLLNRLGTGCQVVEGLIAATYTDFAYQTLSFLSRAGCVAYRRAINPVGKHRLVFPVQLISIGNKAASGRIRRPAVFCGTELSHCQDRFAQKNTGALRPG